MIASLGSIWVFYAGSAIFLIVPLLILAIPVGDTLFAIVRRYRNQKPIFQADQGHLHHRLLKRGISHRNVVLILLGATAGCCFIAFMIVLGYYIRL